MMNIPFIKETFLIEIYKIIKKVAPPIMKLLFLFRENVLNIRKFQIISNSTKTVVRYGFVIPSYGSTFLWAK